MIGDMPRPGQDLADWATEQAVAYFAATPEMAIARKAFMMGIVAALPDVTAETVKATTEKAHRLLMRMVALELGR